MRRALLVFGGLASLVLSASLFLRNRQFLDRLQTLQTRMDSTNVLLSGYAADSVGWARSKDSLQGVLSRASFSASVRLVRLTSALQGQAQAESALVQLRGQVQEDSLSPQVQALLQGERENAQQALQALGEARGVISAQDTVITGWEAQGALDSARIASLETLKSRLQSERDSAKALIRVPRAFGFTFELSGGVGCAGWAGTGGCGPSVQITLVRMKIPFLSN